MNSTPKKKILLFALFIGFFFSCFFLQEGKTGTLSKKKLKDLNIILVTIDTLRADYVSIYGKEKALTPNLDRIARDGIFFKRCIAQTPLTLPSHTTILSGTYPLYNQVRDNGLFIVPQELELVSEVLKDAGFLTAAFIGAYVLSSYWEIDQGFDYYSDEFENSDNAAFSLQDVQRDAGEVLKAAKSWLREYKDKKFFIWIHLYDPHAPYTPPAAFARKYPDDLYRGEVEYTDYELGKFFSFLEEEAIFDKSLIIITSDHGESLGQHKEDEHGFFIYEPAVWVPLIIRGPVPFPVKCVDNIVELVDIAPTILHAMKVRIPNSYQGESLLPLLFGGKVRKKDIAYTETYYPRIHFGWSELKGIYSEEWKYINAPLEELFEIKEDSEERRNLAGSKRAVVMEMRKKIQRFIEEKSKNSLVSEQVKGSYSEIAEKLASLGYVSTRVDTSGEENLPDPKEKIDIYKDFKNALILMQSHKYEEAIEKLKILVKKEAQMVDGYISLGSCYEQKKMYKEALQSYYKALEINPLHNVAMMKIVLAYIELDKLDKALEEATRFLHNFEKKQDLYTQIGLIYFLKKEYEKSLAAFEKSISLEGSNAKVLNKIGEIYILKGDFSFAESYIRRALEVDPLLMDAYFNLAQIAMARGDSKKAFEYYKKELENNPSNFKASQNIAEYLRARGRYGEAIPYYRMTIESAPWYNIPYFLIANYYFGLKTNIEEAIELCKKGIAIEPKDKYTLSGCLLLARIYAFLGKKKEEQFYLNEAERLKQKLSH